MTDMNHIDLAERLTLTLEVDQRNTRLYRNSEHQVHRIHGAAIEYTSGTRLWYQNDRLHRTDGAAVMWSSGACEWWIDGHELTEAEFRARVSDS